MYIKIVSQFHLNYYSIFKLSYIRFRWDTNGSEMFSIFPDEGYSSPGMTITFSVIFHPKELSYEIDEHVSIIKH